MISRTSAITLVIVTSLFNVACQQRVDTAPDVEFITAPGTEELDLPFSPAVRVGHTLYLSGNIGNKPGEMDLVPGGIAAETRQTMENIKTTLALAGASMDQVVKCSVFMADISEWADMNKVYITYFETPPARSAFGANGLALGARVEIDCIAVVK